MYVPMYHDMLESIYVCLDVLFSEVYEITKQVVFMERNIY